MPHPRVWKPFVARRQLRLLRGRRRAVLPAARRVTLSNQLGAMLVDRTSTDRAKNAITAATVAVDLVALGFFKYYGFFVDSIAHLLDDPGSGAPLPLLTVALPVGLSFFTFQAISYVVDVRRGLLRARDHHRLGDLSVVLPAPRRGADRPRARVPAAARHAARPARRRGRRGRAADRLRPDQEGGRSPTSWRATSSTRCSPCRRPTARPTRGRRSSATPCRSTATSPATPTSRSALALLMGFIFPQNFNRPYRARASASSGGAGT